MIGESKKFVVDTAEGPSYLVNTEDESGGLNDINLPLGDLPVPDPSLTLSLGFTKITLRCPILGGSSKSKVKVCSKDMTEDDRKRCKTVCDNEGKGSETFYDFKRVQYDYTDKNIIHMGKDGEKAGLAKIPPEKSFKDYKGKVLLVVNLSSFCTLAVQVGGLCRVSSS